MLVSVDGCSLLSIVSLSPRYLSTNVNKFGHLHYCEPAELGGGYLFASWTSAGEGSDLERPEMVVSRACCCMGEHMAFDQVLRGLDIAHMLILVSKTIFISVCTPLVAIRFSASDQLVYSNILSCHGGGGRREWFAGSSGGRREALEEK
jgi:hypothetical protein